MEWISLKRWNGDFKDNSRKVNKYLKQKLKRTIELGYCVVIDTEDCVISATQLAAICEGLPENKLKVLDFTQPEL